MSEQIKKTACLALTSVDEACQWLGEEGNDADVRRALELAFPLLSALEAPGGASLFAHAVGAARIVDELKLGHEAVLATLLYPLEARVEHETLESFGEAAQLAKAVSAMSRIEVLAHGTQDLDVEPGAQIESLRQMVLAMVQDVRAVLVKLAERTHALRCAARAEPELQEMLGHQARELFAPLANRLGVWQVKWEMEDWACRYLDGETYRRIASLLDEKRRDRERYIAEVVARLKAELGRHGIKAEVMGRPKHIASIINKMRRKNLGFEQLYDIRAVRVLVDKEADCYAVLGIVHNLWQPIPSEFDDYISHPKSNDYRSLHTAVVGPEDKALEVQIRTFDMHRHAELGVAAHWRYKEGGKNDARMEEKIAWLRQLLEWKDDVADASEFAAQFRTELFQDQVYVITPLGRVVALDRGATPIDFAYALHTDLGHRCRGARVDGAMVPLNTPLENGQRVEILTVKQGSPSRDWLNPQLGYVQTHRARAKVRTWFKQRDQGELTQLGRTQLDKERKRLGVGDIKLDKLAQDLKFKSTDEFLAALGRGDVGPQILARALREQGAPAVPAPVRKAPLPRKSASGVLVEGLGDVPLSMARCCKPEPPAAIVAYTTVGRGVTVHRKSCPNLAKFNPDRILQAGWSEKKGEGGFAFEVRLHAFDRQGLLRDVSDVFTRERVDVLRVNTESLGEYANMAITLRVRDAAQIGRLISRLGQVQSVISVKRG
ncbi:bifunctional (p)ppGpp synthetase/guanosine-3',5'-bis(diphosphate) 3'-pyrophosphohydrolase [Betaproteobacteria bacterium SCN2]|jgi:GTP pyrophosphokinase|nr:bifunctional (p)ppGpp synthetase/guanosine-3',5'-bis(diphosphate) 3'-pyrophosphohydrolase [Betaproteobacteria bacterium SCN2]